MNARQLPSSDYLALKAAFRELVRMAGGPNKAAGITRGNASLLSRYGAPHEEMFAPDDVVADLEAEVGEPVVTRIRAELAGFHLVPKCLADSRTDFLRHLGALGKEGGELQSTLAQALADGAVDVAEAIKCRSDLKDLARMLACLDQDLEAVATGVPLRMVPRAAS